MIPQPGFTLTDSIVDRLRDRKALVVLDNCEHVIDPAASLARVFMDQCPGVTLLVTSREPLGIPGERVVPIPSLHPEVAVELFVQRSTAFDDTLLFTDEDRLVIARICNRLDGIPLAIELAAARMRAMSVIDLAERLDDRFKLLRGAGRGGLERHQTLRAAVNWSHQLLAPVERHLFDRLSVFAGTFDLAAVEAICTDEFVPLDDVVDVLAALVDKSVVVADRTVGATRYRLLETLRQFGEEQIDARGETSRWRDRHATHFASVADLLFDEMFSPDDLRAAASFERKWDNLRAAHQWFCATDDVESADRLLRTVSVFAYDRFLIEHRDWTRDVFDASARTGIPTDLHTYNYAITWAEALGEPEAAITVGCSALERSPDSSHPATVVTAGHVARIAWFTGDLELFRATSEQSRHGPEPEDFYLRSIWLWSLVTISTGAEAVDYAVRLVDDATSSGSRCCLASAKYTMALALQYQHPPRSGEALDAAVTSFELAGETKNVWCETYAAVVATIAATHLERPDAITWGHRSIALLHETQLVARSAYLSAIANLLERAGDAETATAIRMHAAAIPGTPIHAPDSAPKDGSAGNAVQASRRATALVVTAFRNLLPLDGHET